MLSLVRHLARLHFSLALVLLLVTFLANLIKVFILTILVVLLARFLLVVLGSKLLDLGQALLLVFRLDLEKLGLNFFLHLKHAKVLLGLGCGHL